MSDYEPSIDPPNDDFVHPDAMRSRAAINLDAERRHAQAQSEQATDTARRVALNQRNGVMATVGTQVGRCVDVRRVTTGIIVTDHGSTAHHNVLLQLNGDQALELAAALTRAA